MLNFNKKNVFLLFKPFALSLCVSVNAGLDRNNGFYKMLYSNIALGLILILLSACGGSSKTQSQNEKPTPKIDEILIDGDMVREKTSTVEINCTNCKKDLAEIRWEIDGNIVSNGKTFTPDFKHLDKTVTIFARVPDEDNIWSIETSLKVELISRKTEITQVVLTGQYTPGTSTFATIECEACLKDTASFTWKIEEKTISESGSFVPSLSNFDKKVSVTAQVLSIDKIASEKKLAVFLKPTPVKASISHSDDSYILMSDGELIHYDPKGDTSIDNDNQQNFVDVYFSKYGRTIALAKDSNGKYFEFGDKLVNGIDRSKFEDIKSQLSTVTSYWTDDFGRHALNSDGKLLSWDTKLTAIDKISYTSSLLSQQKVENVKQVIPSIHNYDNNVDVSAILFTDGRLVIEGFFGSEFKYEKHEWKKIKKIQPLSYASSDSYDAVAIFDEHNNVEIWTNKDTPFINIKEDGQNSTGFGELTNVERIISPSGSSAILAIKNDGSYALRGSGLSYKTDVINTKAKVKGLIQLKDTWALLDESGNLVKLGNHLYPISGIPTDYELTDLSYSVNFEDASVITKISGDTLLATQNNPLITTAIKQVFAKDHYFYILGNDNNFKAYFSRDASKLLDAEYFSNGLGYVEDVDKVIDANVALIVRTIYGEYVFVQSRDNDSSYIHDILNKDIENIAK
ncbi:MAG: hypothetical protein HRT37_11060 [Alteromonadaceae bacterium]|nr:hypothetical protein [Alteromonadaceae bacterium]